MAPRDDPWRRLGRWLFAWNPPCRLVCWRAPRRSGAALTFDDGPNPDCTPVVLDMLKEAGARATFFVEGQKAEAHPDLVRRIAADGHELGNHGFLHEGPVAEQARRCRGALRACGVDTRLFRPPMGRLALRDLPGLWREGYRVVLWSFDAHDSMRHEGKWSGAPPDYGSVRRGDIVLMHDDNPVCLEELPRLLEHLARARIEARGVSHLLGWDARVPR